MNYPSIAISLFCISTSRIVFAIFSLNKSLCIKKKLYPFLKAQLLSQVLHEDIQGHFNKPTVI